MATWDSTGRSDQGAAPAGRAGTPPRRGLRIGIVAPPWLSVPPQDYGGTEQVVDQLARGLAAAGHEVELFATGDSTCPVRRRHVFEEPVGTNRDVLAELAQIEAAYDAFRDVDLIHDHTLLGPLWASTRPPGPLVVTTAHGALTESLAELYQRASACVSIVAISRHQASCAPEVPVAAVIHHGVDVQDVPVGRGDGGYLAFLGRMSPDKGVHRAIRIARRAGRRLLIAAKMWEPTEYRYFEEQVEPLLGDDVEYLGQLRRADKFALLGGAEALLNPIRWAEPFGLVMVEALAAGTPVVSYREGAAPEIVDHGVTGFVCDDEDDMVACLSTVGELDRSRCRRVAEARFSTDRMIDDHLALYGRLLGTPTVVDRAPVGPVPASPPDRVVPTPA
jgi:glycosyltransferase involved in cell wall biosynthesis